MLQDLRDQTQGTGFKILVGALIVVLTLFGFGATALFSGADPEVSAVGDVSITQSMLNAETERERLRLLNRAGPDFDPSQIDRLELQGYVLEQVISREVMNGASRKLGVRMSDQFVNRELVNSPAYQVDGQFNESVYRQNVQSLGYRPVEFLEVVNDEFTRIRLQSAVVDTSALTNWEVSEMARLLSQVRDVAYLPLNTQAFTDLEAVTDEDITTRYEEDQAAFQTELALDLEVLDLSVDNIVATADLTVEESDITELYESDRAAALADQQRDSSHILIQVNEGRDRIAAQALMTEIQTRLNDGETFEDLAKELSEDPGSAANGGSLGPVGKGIFAQAFEDALWALDAPGDLSAPTETEFGLHLIRLDGIVETQYPSLDSQREELSTRIARLKAQEMFADQLLEAERLAYEERESLTSTAEAVGSSLQSFSKITQNGATDLDAAIVAAAFSEDVLAGLNSNAIEVSPERVVFVRVADEYPPQTRPLEEVKEDIRNNIAAERAAVAVEQAKAEGLTLLEAGESTREIAERFNSQWQSFARSARSSANGLPQYISQYAFELPRPTVGEKAVGAVNTPTGAALVTVTEVYAGDINATPEAQIAELERALAGRNARVDFEGFFLSAEDALGVERPSRAAEAE